MTTVINVGNRVVNAYLLTLNGKTVLIDTGYPESFAAFEKRLHKQGLTINRIDYMFLTHAHDDHAGFLAELLKRAKMKVILHEKALPALRAGQNDFTGGCTSRLALISCAVMKWMGKGEHRFPPIPDEAMNRLICLTPDARNALETELGVQFFDTPGHTDCSVSLLTEDGLLFCGDAAMNGFPSAKRVTIWARDLGEFRASWETMLNHHPQTLYPGHGKPFPPSDLKRWIRTVEKRRCYSLS